MTEAEIERLATMIADAILRAPGTPSARAGSWLPDPIRPAPPARNAAPPVWSGAAQSLGDVAPIRHPEAPTHRATTAELTRATRAAAAGRGDGRPSNATAGGRGPVSGRGSNARRRNVLPIQVSIGISKRHIHLSADHVRLLFGAEHLTSLRAIKQPGQFAANEVVDVVGPKGHLSEVRVVGPARGQTQVEIARSDAAVLGIDPPLAASGDLHNSAGGVSLVGPYGRVDIATGVIVAARHLHVSPSDAERWGLRDGDRIDARCGIGPRQTVFRDILVRSGEAHATELHLDSDESFAAAVRNGDLASIVARRDPAPRTRQLITERDVIAIARSGGTLPATALLTPSAKDRARALGLRS